MKTWVGLIVILIAFLMTACEKKMETSENESVSSDQHSYDHVSKVEQKSGHEHEEGSVRWTDQQIETSGIDILSATSADIADEVVLQGEIKIAPDSEVTVLAPASAVVVSAKVNLGQLVQAGDVLAILEGRELADMKRSYLEARERQRLAERDFQREEMLWKEKISAEQDYWQSKSRFAEATLNVASSRAALLSFGLSERDIASLSFDRQGNLAQFSVRAPITGRITQRNLSLGQRVTQDGSLFVISDTNKLVALLSAASSQAASLQEGQVVVVEQVNGDVSGEGVVSVVMPQLNTVSRTLPVQVVLKSHSGWQAGQYVKARVVKRHKKVAVAVVREAVQEGPDGPVVFIKEGNEFDQQSVVLGMQDAHYIEVLEGVSAGQQYVGKNSFLLKADLGKAEAEHEH